MESYYWVTANETNMGDYLTRKKREFIDSFLEINNIGTCLDATCRSGRFSIPTYIPVKVVFCFQPIGIYHCQEKGGV